MFLSIAFKSKKEKNPDDEKRNKEILEAKAKNFLLLNSKRKKEQQLFKIVGRAITIGEAI